MDLVPGPRRVRRDRPAAPDPRRRSRRHRAQSAEAVVRNLSGRLLSGPGGGAPPDCQRAARQPEPAACPSRIEIEQLAMTPADRVALAESMRQLGDADGGDFDGGSPALAPAPLDQAGGARPSSRRAGTLPRAATPRVFRCSAWPRTCPARCPTSRALPVPRRPGRTEQRRQTQWRPGSPGDAHGYRRRAPVDDHRLRPWIRRDGGEPCWPGWGSPACASASILAGGHLSVSSEPGLRRHRSRVRVPIVRCGRVGRGASPAREPSMPRLPCRAARPRSVADGDSPNTAL